jgi:hypothetical protein
MPKASQAHKAEKHVKSAIESERFLVASFRWEEGKVYCEIDPGDWLWDDYSIAVDVFIDALNKGLRRAGRPLIPKPGDRNAWAD